MLYFLMQIKKVLVHCVKNGFPFFPLPSSGSKRFQISFEDLGFASCSKFGYEGISYFCWVLVIEYTIPQLICCK